MTRGWLSPRSAPKTAPVEDRALTRETVPSVMLPGSPGPVVTASAALAIADVFACVRALADTAASLPLIAYRRTHAGRERFSGRLASLLTQPAPAATTANLVGTVVAHLNLHGNAYIAKYRDGEGQIVQLGCLPPEQVSVTLEAGRPIFTVMRASGVSRHGPADVLHIRALSTDGLLGLSPIRQARAALGLAQALVEHGQAVMDNGGRPSGILSARGQLTTESAEQIRSGWQDRHGSGKAGVAVLEGGWEFTPLAMPLHDAQYVEQRGVSTAEVARIFRVPPWIIGAASGDSLTYSTVEGQAQAFVTFALRPWLVLIEQALSADPDLAPASVYVEFLLDGLLRADHRTRAEVYTAALNPQTGWMTRAEVRRLENLAPEPPSYEEAA